jgi:hypothetical protein
MNGTTLSEYSELLRGPSLGFSCALFCRGITVAVGRGIGQGVREVFERVLWVGFYCPASLFPVCRADLPMLSLTRKD